MKTEPRGSRKGGMRRWLVLAVIGGAVGLSAGLVKLAVGQAPGSVGAEAKPGCKPYLNMPARLPLTTGQWLAIPAFPHLKFSNPTFLTHVPGSTRLVVLEREGVIKSFENTPTTEAVTTVLDIRSRCQGEGDSGLLGLAFHPDFGKPKAPNRGFFYICYNYAPNPIRAPGQPREKTLTHVRVARFTVPDGQLTADPESELVLIEQKDEHIFHTGGAMLFHPDDGLLYVAFGDEGHYGGRLGNCQRIDRDLFAGVIRIDVDCDAARSHRPPRQPLTGKTAHYFIPNDNPFVGVPNALEEFYAIGLRSPHRMTIDAATQEIWLGDVGDGGKDPREEVNLIVQGGNYQWNYKEGTQDRPVYARKPKNLLGVEQGPVHEYRHTDGNQCVIGGYVYRGQEHAESLGGKYIFGDFRSGRIWALDRPGNGPPVVAELCALPPATCWLTSFGVDQGGELYLCTLQGTIFKLARAGTPAVPLGNQQPLPARLSQTGAFEEVRTLTPSSGLVPYEVNVSLWADHAEKQRWIALPTGSAVEFNRTGAWKFPPGTVLVKHFELPVGEAERRRLETRLLVCTDDGGAYGVTYKWREDRTDADLLPGGLKETVAIKTPQGVKQQVWTYPSRSDCMTCHNPTAGFVLGVNTRQLNCPGDLARSGQEGNQLLTWSRWHMLNPPVSRSDLADCPRLAPLGDETASLEERARSYLDANCAHCHQTDRLQSSFDARYQTPLFKQKLIDVAAYRTEDDVAARLVVPGDPERSLLYRRMASCENDQMPPLGRSLPDEAALEVISGWIQEIPRLRWQWCMKVLLALAPAFAGAAATCWWWRRWLARREFRRRLTGLLAGLPMLSVMAAAIAVAVINKHQGNAAWGLGGISLGLGIGLDLVVRRILVAYPPPKKAAPVTDVASIPMQRAA